MSKENKVPLLSIIIPMYNVKGYIEKAITSILKNKVDKIEVIIVNDGSTDSSLELAEKLVEGIEYIKIIDKKNEGVGIARNTGFSSSSGKYIYFMDPDDYLEVNFIENISRIIKKNNPNVIMFGVNEINELGQVINKKSPKSSFYIRKTVELAEKYNDLEKQIYMFSPWNKVYKRSFLLENDIYFSNQKVGQDALFNIEVLKVATDIYVEDGIYYNYLVQRKNSAQTKFNAKKKYDEFNIFLNYKKLFLSWKIDGKKNYSGYAVYLFKNNLNNFLSLSKDTRKRNNYYDKEELRYLRSKISDINLLSKIKISIIINFPYTINFIKLLKR